MRLPIKISVFSALFVLYATATNAAADLVVIVNPDNPLASLSVEDAKRIYLGKDKSFPNGDRIAAADQAENSPSRKKFYADVIQKSESQLKAYWSQMIFTGKDTPPEVIGNDAAVKKWVAENKNAIGYVDGSIADGSVKVLLRIH